MVKTKKLITEPRDLLDPAELELESRTPLLIPGHPYLWVLTHGWAVVGFFVKWETPLRIRLAHASHFHDAGKNYERIAQEGIDKKEAWRYEGAEEINFAHEIRVCRYMGQVPRGPIHV